MKRINFCAHCDEEKPVKITDKHGNDYCGRSCFAKHTCIINKELAADRIAQARHEADVGRPVWQKRSW